MRSDDIKIYLIYVSFLTIKLFSNQNLFNQPGVTVTRKCWRLTRPFKPEFKITLKVVDAAGAAAAACQ